MDIEKLEQHIQLIYMSVNDPTLWTKCLKEIGESIEAKSAKIETGSRFEELTLLVKTQISQIIIRSVTTHLEKKTLSISDKKNFQLLPLSNIDHEHNKFEKCKSSENTIHAYIGQSSDNLVRISFDRCISQDPYEDIHIVYLNRLLPHIKQALALCKKTFQQETEIEVSQKILDSTQSVVLIIDSDMNIIKKSTKSNELLSKEILLKTCSNKITGIYGLTQKEFCFAINSVTKNNNSNIEPSHYPFLIPNNKDGGFLLLEISRFEINLGSSFDLLKANILAMITIRELSNKHESLENRLKLLFSLSDSEAEISTLLSNGLTPKEIANKRNRSIETIRTQIKQICIKLGVKNTNSLIAHINHINE